MRQWFVASVVMWAFRNYDSTNCV